MSFGRFARMARWAADAFPERRITVRSKSERKVFTLSTEAQLGWAALAGVAALWVGLSTATVVAGALGGRGSESELAQVQAKYERWIADRQARLASAETQLSASSSSLDSLAQTMQRRHEALAMILGEVAQSPGAQQALSPLLARAGDIRGNAADRIEAVRSDEERLIEAAGAFAKSRADRLRTAFRLAGLDPALYAGRRDALGGPLIQGGDPRALAAILDVDPDFARRIQVATEDLADTRLLAREAEDLPFARPAPQGQESSPYGARIDPFTGQPAFHPGEDFSGPYLSAVVATAPGVVSFAGEREGYGGTVEIDHGHGFKTRYAHLAATLVKVGQPVTLGQRIGAMGSTGRSTGTHVHYEVWVDGRSQNPSRFLKAGQDVQQASD